jgi:hypothetical protein
LLSSQISQVCLPFHRGANGRSNAKGIGLGLAISKSLVEKMGGKLVVSSTLGKGSTFSFQLTFDVVPRQPSSDGGPLVGHTHTNRQATSQMPGKPVNALQLSTFSETTLGGRTRSSHSLPVATILPTGQDLNEELSSESTPLHFLVVDDNILNKELFSRTVDNMFRKLNRPQMPVYTFASDGGQTLPHSIVLLPTHCSML